MSTEAPGQATSPSADQPETFGPYRLEERIGRGGMGEVFRAFDTARQRTVALKRLPTGLVDDTDYQERFRRECRLAARLSSPHVIPIHDFGTIDGRLYLDMRLVTGNDLAAEIEQAGQLEPRRAVEIVRQIADALDAAHEDGLVHRDVKPSNVLLTAHRGRDFVYLVDFGIVRAMSAGPQSSLTATGTAIGTLAYMAPELFAGQTAGPQVDVYALGCLLFETVAGRAPFLGQGPGLMYDHLSSSPPRLAELVPGTPAALDDVITRAMSKDPAQRPASAGDLADAAIRAVGGGSGPVPTTDRGAAGSGPSGSGPSAWSPSGPIVPPARSPSGPHGPVTGSPSGPQDSPSGSPSGPQGPPVGSPSGPQGSPSGPHGRRWSPSGPNGRPGSDPRVPAPAPPYIPTGAAVGGPPMSGPAGLSGAHPPPWNAGPVYPPAPPARSRRGRTFAIVAVIVLVLALVGVGTAVLVHDSGGSTPTAAPPTPTAPPLAVTTVFPDANASTCQRSSAVTTESGVVASEAYVCDYSRAAPGAQVIFARWSSAADAQAWYQDTANKGPRLEQFSTWKVGEVPQGVMYTAQAGPVVQSTGIYDGLTFGWQVRGATLDQMNAAFGTLQLQPRTAFGG